MSEQYVQAARSVVGNLGICVSDILFAAGGARLKTAGQAADLPDIPEEITKDIEINFCARMEDVLDIALGSDKIAARRAEVEAEIEAKKEAQRLADQGKEAHA